MSVPPSPDQSRPSRTGRDARRRPHHGRRDPLQSFVLLVAAATSSTRVVSAFTGHFDSPGLRPRVRPLPDVLFRGDHGCTFDGCGLTSTSLRLSVQDEAAPLDFEPEPLTPPTSANVLEEPSNFISQQNPASDGISPIKLTSLAVTSIVLLSALTDVPSTAIATYSSLLVDHPTPTKSLTSGFLCGISDIIAQFRDPTRRDFNYRRLIRFAGKGCVGGIVWSFWYDNLDKFLDMDNDINIFKLSGIVSDSGDFLHGYRWIRDHLSAVTTLISILIEQFFWCPIVFGTFEIPISTLLNGGSFSTVPKEVDSKLGGLLVENAKVWTLANVAIYNTPVEWRPALSNVVDVFWQSIVSDVAADCGKVENDICELPPIEAESLIPRPERDFSFFAEKSRL